jgi:membrane protein implicated in regulation of membrane protease activity
VLEDIDNDRNMGAVSCDGKIWSARTVDGTAVKKDEKVRVIQIKGVKLIVEPVNKYAEN